jgi:drug/metabolite transporter (DMT)-like permease
MSMSARMSLLDWSLLLALSLLWGGSYFFVGVAVKALPPFTIVLLRVAIAAVALHAVLRLTRTQMPWDAGAWAAFFGMGLLNNAIPFSLIVWGQTHIASGLASILNATTPLFALVVAHLVTHDERLSKGRLVGILLGLAGVVVLIGPDALTGLGNDVLAQIAVLAAALSYGCAVTFGRRFKRMGVPPLATAAGQVTASSVILLPVALLVDAPWRLELPDLSVWGAVLGLALLSTALAYVVFFRILASAGAVNLSLVTFLIPVSAILLGSVFLGERLEPMDFLGMALIGLGLTAIDGRLAGRLAARRNSAA